MVGSRAAVMSEVLSPTGGVADKDQLQNLVQQHAIPCVDIADIARSRAHTESAFHILVETSLPTVYGPFKAIAVTSPLDDSPYVALASGDVHSGAPLVSVHLRCVAGALRSTSCHCREQIDYAMQLIGHEGGILLHLPRSAPHDVAVDQQKGTAGAVTNRELAALVLRALGITRIRAIAPGPLTEPGPEFGLEIVDTVTPKEAVQ
jgi:3,4-dihydroxy 2-butanone 4-phosphate synthase/GTP cyclohydrolase II